MMTAESWHASGLSLLCLHVSLLLVLDCAVIEQFLHGQWCCWVPVAQHCKGSSTSRGVTGSSRPSAQVLQLCFRGKEKGREWHGNGAAWMRTGNEDLKHD